MKNKGKYLRIDRNREITKTIWGKIKRIYITLEEVQKQMNTLKKGNTPEVDGIKSGWASREYLDV